MTAPAPPRQVPAPLPERLHRRGQQHRPRDRRVDQHRHGERDAELLERDLRRIAKIENTATHHDCRARDDARGRLDPPRRRRSRSPVLGSLVTNVSPAPNERPYGADRTPQGTPFGMGAHFIACFRSAIGERELAIASGGSLPSVPDRPRGAYRGGQSHQHVNRHLLLGRTSGLRPSGAPGVLRAPDYGSGGVRALAAVRHPSKRQGETPARSPTVS